MVLTKAFSNTIKKILHGDIQVFKVSDAQFLKIGREIAQLIK